MCLYGAIYAHTTLKIIRAQAKGSSVQCYPMDKTISHVSIKIGDVYWLKFPGIAARVIEPPEQGSMAPKGYPILVESLVCRVRWYINEFGEGSHSPQVLVDRKLNKADMILALGLVLIVLAGVPCALWVRSQMGQ
jgi:hypothetical protein